jgi:hypothetical protein
MRVRINEGDIHLTHLRTRMPFKYGIATMTGMPMVFVRVHVEVDGRQSLGMSADLLPPKWFTKDPARALDDEIREMGDVIGQAVKLATGLEADSPFAAWKGLYEWQMAWGRSSGIPPLLANFGTSLVERAMLDAVCRVAGRSFAKLVLGNKLGIKLGDLHPSLAGTEPPDFLPAQPLASIIARHTVGLSDPLSPGDVQAGERVDDGLPQALDDCIRVYGLRHFKIKVNGDLERDTARLRQLAGILAQHAPKDFAFTLDGNEQFKSLEAFRAFWEPLAAMAEMKGFLEHLLFVEQPLHRSEALKPEVGAAMRAWAGCPPMIIDESDATLESLPEALTLGYAGTSHKNCKGVFKGIANRCLLAKRTMENPGARAMMSGEDLCNVGPVALLQDLAVMAVLGIESVERNGHHYNAGLSQFPKAVQEQILKLHPDLYHASPARWPTLTIRDGRIDLGSINESPFGVRFLVDVKPFTRYGKGDGKAET